MNKIYDVIIVGGGASGLFAGASHNINAAGAASPRGLIIEGSKSPGIKMMMSGSGQCNITHSGSIKDFPAAYGKAGGKIRSALFRYNNVHLCEFLSGLGIETFSRDDGKVFPVSLDAGHVVSCLRQKCLDNGFEIRTGCRIDGISKEDDIFRLTSGEETFSARKAVVAAGGCSYPSTGSDGSMLELIRKNLNIEITAPVPALVPVTVENYPWGDLSGISFPNSICTIRDHGKVVDRVQGPLLFTHEEFSGPAILDISRSARPGRQLEINYPGMNFDAVKEVLTDSPDKLNLPKRFASLIYDKKDLKIKEAGIKLTSDTYTISGTLGFKKAMVTAGGVSLDEINLKTMECKNVPGLFVIGEALDIDGKTGGYNLQFAYASACAALL